MGMLHTIGIMQDNNSVWYTLQIEAIRGSYWSNLTGRTWGMSIGRDVIVDSW